MKNFKLYPLVLLVALALAACSSDMDRVYPVDKATAIDTDFGVPEKYPDIRINPSEGEKIGIHRTGEVVDMRRIDCGMLIQLENGAFLNPRFNCPLTFRLVEGMQVDIVFLYSREIDETCQLGRVVRVLSIKKKSPDRNSQNDVYVVPTKD